MSKARRYIGFFLAAPITFIGLIYALLFASLGWYKWYAVNGDALVWLTCEKMPKWLTDMWAHWGGQAIGNVVVLKYRPEDKPMLMTHEARHVEQCMRIGLLQPLAYGLMYLAVKYGCPGSDPYYDCSFEIDARRHAGQIVDVVGTINRIKNLKG